jgi:hypothetical protein
VGACSRPDAPPEGAAPAGEEAPPGSAEQPAAGQPVTSATGTVSILEPADGATVSSPVTVCMELTGVTLAAAGTVEPGKGHHHLYIDPTADEQTAILRGDALVIPNDETHVHMGDASTCKDLELAPGTHLIFAVVGDGAHTNLNPPVTDQVSITVE